MSSLTITVLFTDLVGSTELLSKVGEARSEELRREVFSICRQAASSHEGREVKNLGDGLMLVFPAPSAGLETAVAIQQLLERRNRHSQEDLLLRIGISTGEVEEEDGDYFGRPVVEAARLCAKARGGEILATEIVKHLAGSRFTHEITSLGPLELKGLEEPVRAISVHWLPLEEPGEPRIPLPRRLRRSPSATFVGRSQELEIIEQKLKAAISEEGRQVILVAGEPGIGKTTLVSQAAAKALERGASVTYGRCDQDLALPYQPFAEALGYLLDNLDTLEIRPEEELHRSVGSLAPLMGGANREDAQAHASGPDAAAERSVLFGAVAGFLEKASRRSGLLLILDDLQWADDPSLSLLGYLCRHSRESKLAILGTFRDAEVGSDHPFSETLVALHREPDVTRISLAGLSDSDALEMMEAIAGHDLGQEGLLLRDALLSETRGNPFFLEEMLRHLAESGALVRHEGRWVAVFDPEHFSLPVSLKEVLGRRVANLGPRTKQTLSVASILGQEFDLELLSGVSGSSLEECLSHCEAATRVGILRELAPGKFAFAHALIARALYDELSVTRRSMLHRQTAELLEARAASRRTTMAEIASHWKKAITPKEEDKAVRFALLAGDEALSRLAPEAAKHWYCEVLERIDWEEGKHQGPVGEADSSGPRMSPSNVNLSSESPLLGLPQHGNAHATRPPLDERSLQQFAAWALAGLGEAEIQLGEPTYLERLLEAGRIAALLDDVDLMVRTAMSCFRGWTLTMGQPVENFISLLEKAVERTRGERTPRHAMLLARLGTELYWKDIEEGYQRGKEAVELARDIGDPTFFARVVATAIYGLITVDSWTEADHLLDEALEALGPRGDPTTRFMLLSNKALVCSQLLDDIALLHDLARETESLSRRLRAPNFLWQQGIIRTAIELIDGDMEAAEEEAKRTFDMGIANSIPEASPIYVGQLTFIRFVQGRYHEVAEAIAQAASQVATIDAYALGAVQISLSAGMTEQAMQLMAPYLERPFDSYRRDHIWPLTMYLLTESLLLLEAVEPRVKKRFPEVVEVLRPHGELLAFTGSVAQESLNASVGKLLHSLGRFEESERYLLKALARHEGLRAPYITARTRIAMARLYKDWGRPGDKERSLALASQVLGVGLEKGYGGLVEEARSLLALLG